MSVKRKVLIDQDLVVAVNLLAVRISKMTSAPLYAGAVLNIALAIGIEHMSSDMDDAEALPAAPRAKVARAMAQAMLDAGGVLSQSEHLSTDGVVDGAQSVH